MERFILVLLLVLAVLFVLPHTHTQSISVTAQNWTVLAGADEEDGALQAMHFLPEAITIHVGDSVTWKLNSKDEHTIYFTAGGPDPQDPIVGPDGKPYLNPAIWFPSDTANGNPRCSWVNDNVMCTSPGSTYDGNGPVSGGVLSAERKTFTLTFTKPGVYEYHCEFHPGMKGTITVLPVDQPLPKTQAAYDQIAQAEAAQALDAAKKLESQLSQLMVNSRSDGTNEYVVDLLGDAKAMATVLRFLPSPLHIHVGDTVTWRMSDFTQLHTVTFLDKGQQAPDFAIAMPQPNGPPKLLVNSQVAMPAGATVYEGQGYFNSGFLARNEGQPAPTYSLTFTKPGTYEYSCLVHDEMGMKATIIVEPNVRQAVADSNSRFMEAFNHGDAASTAGFYTEDARLLAPNNPMVQGRQKIQEFFTNFIAMSTYRELVLKTLEVHDSADLAYDVGTYTLTLQPQSASQSITDTGKYVTVWKRQADGSWKIAADIWNSDLPLAPAQTGAATTLQPAVLDVAQLAAHSQKFEDGSYGTPIAATPTGDLFWGRSVNSTEPLSYSKQDFVYYLLQGQGTLKFADGSSSPIGPGQLVVIPAGVALGFTGTGDYLAFSTPPENDRDTVYLEGPMAKPGAKAPSMDKPQIIDVAQRIAQGLEQKVEGFQYTVAYETKTGGVEFFRIDQGVALHKHPKENHILYILKGHGRGQIGDQTAEVGPGQIVVIPAGVPHKFERIGDEPLDFILFSTPPFNPDDIVWLK